MDSVTHIKNKSAAECDTSKGKWKANPLVNGGNCGSEDCGLLGGHNGPDNQPAERPSLFSLQGVSVETERRSLLMLHELTRSLVCVSAEQKGDK